MSESMVRLVEQRYKAEALVERFRERVAEAQSLSNRAQAALDEARSCERQAVKNLLEAQTLLVETLDDIRVEHILGG